MPISPSCAWQQEHLRQPECQYLSIAWSRNRSTMRPPHPAHDFTDMRFVWSLVWLFIGLFCAGELSIISKLIIEPCIIQLDRYFLADTQFQTNEIQQMLMQFVVSKKNIKDLGRLQNQSKDDLTTNNSFFKNIGNKKRLQVFLRNEFTERARKENWG